MKLRFLALLLFFVILLPFVSRADEGMWLPMLISKYNYADMQKLGLKLNPEQIYSINQDCLKDAVVALDHGGCTGSVISSKGLMITNHHCGFDAIAKQSSVDHDYLTDGFWAMRPEEELPLPGKTVSFLIRMEDVTEAVLAGIFDTLNEESRAEKIQRATDSISAAVKGDSGYEVSIESMFAGNEYYLFVYQRLLISAWLARLPRALESSVAKLITGCGLATPEISAFSGFIPALTATLQNTTKAMFRLPQEIPYSFTRGRSRR